MDDTTGNHVVKEFQLVIDPRSLPDLADMSSRDATAALQHLRDECGIRIDLFSVKCKPGDSLFRNTALANALVILPEVPASDFQLHKTAKNMMLEGPKNLVETEHDLSLLALSQSTKADGIVTNSAPLIEHQYVIYQYHRIRIVPVDEFLDFIRVIAVGNSVFWSSACGRDIGFDNLLSDDTLEGNEAL